MRILLVPGLWLDASSWSGVVPLLEVIDHHAHPVTLPGAGRYDGRRSEVTLADQIAAVVELIDGLDDDVVLVGHSAGAAVVHAAADARPERVARLVYVDAVPGGPGSRVAPDLPVTGGVIPLPDWDVFEEADLVDLTEELRADLRARAIPAPARVASDELDLHDEARFTIPATVVSCEFTPEQLRAWMAAGEPATAELARMDDVTIVHLPTGHWPQFTRPGDLAATLARVVGPA
ncbi:MULTISPECIES: alpha/beta fold hydrolase [unclassified Pseudactinotalea]|uniref:alpha/beta fold hydrolase n=1 Tax=unclassified Pseudactinotalea TaxID=2649176 RepID=UPI00128AF589|nr:MULTISPECIES: alpha/beta hydrolase [unclassified Pseudactinotalea]MPV49300.1 alpha/beta fold hydrolase [Pseudactinotalea sp. HY160]QGH69405.1 alpha/beta fold hydrolase [Pseudactinotalea sp. HY158]